MSLLSRPDGIQFVVQPYRERMAIGKRSVMVQRIRLLSEQQGQYVSLYPLGQDAIEAVFSKEAGYLLGESVWAYFNKPAYLIFCERLSKDNNQVLLVVVRANEIYLDALVDNDKLRNELLPLMTMQESFRVITYGDVSLSQTEGLGRFALPKNLVNSFEVAEQPVFKNLPILPSARLLTLLLALKSSLLGPRVSPTAVMITAAAILAIVWWIYAVSPPRHETVIAHKLVAQQPDLGFADFYSAMRSPAPGQQLDELARIIPGFYALPGWQAGDIKYDGSRYHIQMDRQGGSLQWLTQWAGNHHYTLNLSSSGAEIVIPSQLQIRPRPQALYPLSQVVASLLDRLDGLFPARSISIGDSRTLGQTQSRTITINFANVSPDTLVLIGDTLGDSSPLSISAINVNTRSGLLNGSVQLSVWGI